jgi:hypothetical protein
VNRIVTILFIILALCLAKPAFLQVLGYEQSSATITAFGEMAPGTYAAYYDRARTALEEYLESHGFSITAPPDPFGQRWGMRHAGGEQEAWYEGSKRDSSMVYVMIHQPINGATGLGARVVPRAEGLPSYRQSVRDKADELVTELNDWWNSYTKNNPRPFATQR